MNLFDELHSRGLDPILRTRDRVPPQLDPSVDDGRTPEEVISSRQALLATNANRPRSRAVV